jgi:nitroreductase
MHQSIVVIFFLLILLPFTMKGVDVNQTDDIMLPEPSMIGMSIDEVIQKRTSIRDFTDESLQLGELSTILLHAFGIREDGTHTIPRFHGDYAVVIYLLMEDGIYRYDPSNHSLVFFKEGDFRSIGQYTAPVQLGICWDQKRNNDENRVGMQIGAVGQNIYHCCVAMGLGTVATAEVPSPLDSIGLPEHHRGRIVMPIGHPTIEATYLFFPMYLSFLPKVSDSETSFTSTVLDWNLSTSMDHEVVSRAQINQFLWACYGYSYYLDHTGFETHYIERHRTVPSAHGYYPLEIFMLNEEGVYWYIPGLRNNDPFGLPIVTFLLKRGNDDVRTLIAAETNQSIEQAPVSFVISLNIRDTIDWDDLSDPSLRWVWTYEAGACVQNMLLDCVAWDFSTRITVIEYPDKILPSLKLNDNFDPFVIVSIG